MSILYRQTIFLLDVLEGQAGYPMANFNVVHLLSGQS
jgi:hypothetical protein